MYIHRKAPKKPLLVNIFNLSEVESTDERDMMT